MDYGNVLSRAWQIVWKHKILWIFGILAGCTQAGTSGGSNSGFRFSGSEFGPGFQRLTGGVSQNTWIAILIAVVVVFLVLWLIAIFLGTVGTIGLVRGTLQAETGAEKLVFADLFSNSMPYFWRVLGLNVLAFLALLILFPIIGVPLGICTCGLGFLALFLFIPVFLELANISIVVENRGVFDALGRSWQMIRDHFGPVLVMALILNVGVSFVAGFIIGLPLLLVLGPVIAGVITQSTTGSNAAIPGGVIVAGLCFLAYLPVLLILSGILRSFLTSSWTLAFTRLTTQPAAVEPVPVTI